MMRNLKEKHKEIFTRAIILFLKAKMENSNPHSFSLLSRYYGIQKRFKEFLIFYNRFCVVFCKEFFIGRFCVVF
jgi:hypothetical protein